MLSLSIFMIWDDSKVCGEKKRNKTTGGYSRLPDGHMHGTVLKANRNARAGQIACEPLGTVPRPDRHSGDARSDMCKNP
jgi:hypothetical protein